MIDTLLMVALYAILVYYLALHGTYFVLIALGALQLRRYHHGIHYGSFKRIAESPLTLPITLVIPAYNEEKIVLGTVAAALDLRYPQHEVILVNDGSSDATLQTLIDAYRLRRVDKVNPGRIPTQPVRGVYESFEHPNLLVIDKENGQRADAINVGVNHARFPLLCIIDADCIFERDALLRAVRPFLRDNRVVAAGGIVRPSNGLEVRDGKITGFGLPRKMLPLLQAVEYLRSFQWARLGLARLGSMLSISGAFLMVKKQVFIDIGGARADSITDDIDTTVRLYKYVHEKRANDDSDLRIDYIPDPVCYTEVPETWRVFTSQRNRWQRGTLQALLRQWRMTFNSRYGMAGMFGMPFFMIFEAFSALVEFLGYIIVPIAYMRGLVTLSSVFAFLLLAVVVGSLLSVAAVLLQERTRMRAATSSDLLRLLWASLLENLGYHQWHLLTRVVGTFDYLIRRRKDVGATERLGYQGALPPPTATPALATAGDRAERPR